MNFVSSTFKTYPASHYKSSYPNQHLHLDYTQDVKGVYCNSCSPFPNSPFQFWPYKNKIRSCHFLASACLQLNPKPSPKPCIKWPWSSLWFGVLLLLCLLKLLVILASLLVLKHAKYAPFSGSLPCFPLPGKCSPQYPVGVALSFRSLLRCHHGRVPSLLSLNWKPLHCISLHRSLLHIIS